MTAAMLVVLVRGHGCRLCAASGACAPEALRQQLQALKSIEANALAHARAGGWRIVSLADLVCSSDARYALDAALQARRTWAPRQLVETGAHPLEGHRPMVHPGLPGGMASFRAARGAVLAGWGPREATLTPP